MGPKKEIKKEVIEQPPKEQVPEIPAHELQGYGRFSYPNGSEYTGEWKLFRGIKMKHGKGVLIIQNISSSQVGKQMYDGEWSEDKMSGNGTYYYSDGAVFKGQWKNNQHYGQGVYTFSNGVVYQGEWERHLMHGTGYFIDHTGKKWGGQFRNGRFQSKNQAELMRQKAISLKKIEIKKQVEENLQSLLDAIAKSDKKTLKDNLSPFFANADNLKELVKEPYSKFDQRPPQKWAQIVNCVKNGGYKVLENANEASLITPDRILEKQLEGRGQFVQIQGIKDDKIFKMGLVGLGDKKWVVVCAVEEERKK